MNRFRSPFLLKFFILFCPMLLALIVGIEAASLHKLKKDGRNLPFLINLAREQRDVATFMPQLMLFESLDPHMGYAHSEVLANPSINPRIPYKRLAGSMAAYGPFEAGQMANPVIVILGGSTTDAFQFEHSWPEELATILMTNQTEGTVINAGVGGYSSAQQLFKLIRDVLPLQPDVVIFYDGINDIGNWARNLHPYVHPYQSRLFQDLTYRLPTPTLLPNTRRIAFLLRRQSDLKVNWGTEWDASLGQSWFTNVRLAEAVCDKMGIRFFHFMQPVAGVGQLHVPASLFSRHRADYLDRLRGTYAFMQSNRSLLPSTHDLTEIFSDLPHAPDLLYEADLRHLTLMGNRIVASNVLEHLLASGVFPSSDWRPGSNH